MLARVAVEPLKSLPGGTAVLARNPRSSGKKENAIWPPMLLLPLKPQKPKLTRSKHPKEGAGNVDRHQRLNPALTSRAGFCIDGSSGSFSTNPLQRRCLVHPPLLNGGNHRRIKVICLTRIGIDLYDRPQHQVVHALAADRQAIPAGRQCRPPKQAAVQGSVRYAF